MTHALFQLDEQSKSLLSQISDAVNRKGTFTTNAMDHLRDTGIWVGMDYACKYMRLPNNLTVAIVNPRMPFGHSVAPKEWVAEVARMPVPWVVHISRGLLPMTSPCVPADFVHIHTVNDFVTRKMKKMAMVGIAVEFAPDDIDFISFFRETYRIMWHY